MDLTKRSRKLFAAMGAGRGVEELLAPRVVYDLPGLGGYRGRREALAFLQAIYRNLPGLSYKIRSVLADGSQTVVGWRLSATCDGRMLTGRGVHILHWDALGRVRRAEVYSDPDLLRQASRVQDASATSPSRLRAGAEFQGSLRHRRQRTDYTCGPAALSMVLPAFGLVGSEAALAANLGTEPRVGTRQRAIERYLRTQGLRARVRHTTATTTAIRNALRNGAAVLVCYWLESEDTDHYAVVRSIGQGTITLADPWVGPSVTYGLEEFERLWRGDPLVHSRRDRWMVEVRGKANPLEGKSSKSTPLDGPSNSAFMDEADVPA